MTSISRRPARRAAGGLATPWRTKAVAGIHAGTPYPKSLSEQESPSAPGAPCPRAPANNAAPTNLSGHITNAGG
eukprot:2411265-Pyramimonas_sp.AAC.1